MCALRGCGSRSNRLFSASLVFLATGRSPRQGSPTVESLTRLFHVTSSRNRESIAAHGLDWERMKDAPGIAGSHLPEQQGVFLCVDKFEVDWFVRMNNTGDAVDVWAVGGLN